MSATATESSSLLRWTPAKKEIQRWRATFPVLLFASDEEIARLIQAVRRKLEPKEEASHV